MANTTQAKQYLRRLKGRMESLTGGRLGQGVMRSFAEEARRLVVEGFQQSKAPDGESWAPSKRKGKMMGVGQILRDKGRLQNSIIPRPTATGLRVTSNVAYAAIHNYGGSIGKKAQTMFRFRGRFTSARKYIQGTERAERYFEDTGQKSRSAKRYRATQNKAHTFGMPRRQFLPSDIKPLPPNWANALQRVADAAMANAMQVPEAKSRKRAG